MALIIGDPIPDPWYQMVHDSNRFEAVKRTCQACGYVWANKEITIDKRHWEQNQATPVQCPMHRIHGVVLVGQSVEVLLKSDWDSRAYSLAISMGAYHRRRACARCFGCGLKDNKCCCDEYVFCRFPMTGRDRQLERTIGMKTRWSTLEVHRDGLVTADVTVCPKCQVGKGKTRMIHRASMVSQEIMAWRESQGLPRVTPGYKAKVRGTRPEYLPDGEKGTKRHLQDPQKPT